MKQTTIKKQNKEKLLKEVGKQYRDCMRLIKDSSITMMDCQEGLYECVKLKDKVDHILQQLPLEYAFLIQKEFLENPIDGWYQKRFSEEEYLHFKTSAIDAFIHCLYG